MPPRSENVTGGLTKIKSLVIEAGTTGLNPQSSGSEVFQKITPRSASRPQHDFLLRKNIAPERIDEGGESGEGPVQPELFDTQHVEAISPSQSTTGELIFRVPKKPPPPLAPTRAHAASIGKAGDLGKIVSSREKKALSTSEHAWEAPSSFFERPQGPKSPRINISTTRQRPAKEETPTEESLNTTPSGEEAIEDLGKVTKIELVEVHRTFKADEYAALLQAEKKSSRIEESKTPAKLKPVKKRSVLPSVRTSSIQVATSIGAMIRELNDPGFSTKTMRALNILYYVVSGKSFIDESLHPEIKLLAEYLKPLWAKDKFAFLKHQYTQVEEHLDPLQKLILNNEFEEMDRLQRQFKNPTLLSTTRHLESLLHNQTKDEATTDV
jgi:hypothetical protein